VLGLFGVGQSLLLLEREILQTREIRLSRSSLDFSKLVQALRHWRTLMRSSVIGTFIGLLPGPGSVLASFVAYDVAKRRSPEPESFGTGNPEGCVAAEAANNAVPAGALIPLLTLGIPGEALSALLLGVFTLNGIYPGPLLLVKEPALIANIYWSMLLINIAAFLMLALWLRPFAMIVKVPARLLAVVVMALSLVGIYAVNTRLFDVGVAIASGVLGYLLLRMGWPVVSLVMGVVMGGIIESRLRESLSLGDGSLWYVLGRPASLAILGVALLLVLVPVVLRRLRRTAG
ncbi:MAG TPA: tripartite tricarboxylate transporter permease, partial [Alphaproteobacteria bacterium]|nr:tripartite tricarboxylate transporter permease [Alphaproteobacteria bacterium]